MALPRTLFPPTISALRAALGTARGTATTLPRPANPQLRYFSRGRKPPVPPTPKTRERAAKSKRIVTIPAGGSASFFPAPSNDPQGGSILAPFPGEGTMKVAKIVFTERVPTMLYSAANFFDIPVNKDIPEVCLLGRSNAGKSTFLNALSNLKPPAARRVTIYEARRTGRAVAGSVAGTTTTINAYGYGIPTLEERAVAAKRAEKEKVKGETADVETRKDGALKKPPLAHRVIVMDMPGYGMGSKAEWGDLIQKYVSRRKPLKGAIVLIDANVGFKDSDRMALEMLRDADIRTAVILTKAATILRDAETWRGQVDAICRQVWEELRAIEKGSLTWLEGSKKGWENEIWVTSAGDPDGVGCGVGMAGARWAICRMAGLVQDQRTFGATPPSGPLQIVSFDDLVYFTKAQHKKAEEAREKATF